MNDFNEPAPWKPLDDTERRVLGVLIEKAKTTPDNYPISLASLTAGCNQKSNRAPQMQLDEDDVEIALSNLREQGVVAEVQGGRVSKFRHLAYDWFGIKGHEIAVLTELMLRGPQTTGELRQRASRMESFDSMEDLLPVLEQLVEKNLVFPLTPPGRGQLFAHLVYLEDELTRLKAQAADGNAKTANDGSSKSSGAQSEISQLRTEVAELREQLETLRQRVDLLES